MNKIIPVAIAIIHKDNTFLLTERKEMPSDQLKFGRAWHFPGGQVEFGEDVPVALKREIREELGVELDDEMRQSKIFTAIRPHWHGILIPYLCTIQENSEIVLNHEAFQYGWFTYEEVKKLNKLGLVIEMLEETMQLLKK